MNFAESTQLRNWQLSADELRRQREENRQRSLGALEQARARSASVASLDTLDSQVSGAPAAAAATAAPVEAPSLAEELSLLKYYGSKLQHVCRELRLPRRVLGTALTYLKRIYLSFSTLEQDPQQLLLTCLYLACKIEEHYISAAELGRLTGMPAELILRTELTALQGLKFDLIVYSPYKAIEGFFEDIKEAAGAAAAAAGGGSNAEAAAAAAAGGGSNAEAAAAAAATAGGGGGGSGEEAAAAAAAVAAAEAAEGLDPGMAALQEEQLAKARAVAYSAADALLLSDAPLLHAPGRLALAALRSGFNKLGIKLYKYVERVAQRSGSSSGSNNADDMQVALARLQAALAELDQLGAEGAQSVEQEQMAAIDRKLKACRTALLEGGGQASAAAAKAKAKADKAARKAAKVAEQRSAAEAAVGILQAEAAPAAAIGEQPAAKRQRQEAS